MERGDAYCGVLPFENSNAGDVSAVLDLLYAHPGLKVAACVTCPSGRTCWRCRARS